MSLPLGKNIILMFHAVNDAAWFYKTITFLRSFYSIVPISEVESYFCSDKEIRSKCIITFDDGDSSFYNIVYPILKKEKICSALFVSPKKILEHRNFWFQEIRGYDQHQMKKIIADYLLLEEGQLQNYDVLALLKCLNIRQIEEIISLYKKYTKTHDKSFLLIDHHQMLEMHKSGLVTFGGHTQNHPILANEDDRNSEFEISSSIHDLSSIINTEVKFFAYPNGIKKLDYTRREIETLVKEGIRISVSTQMRNFSLSDSRQELPRIGLTRGSLFHLTSKIILSKFWDRLKNTNTEYNQRIKIYSQLKANNNISY